MSAGEPVNIRVLDREYTVGVAPGERDALIADTERRAGAALKALTSSGLSTAEAARWCDLADKDAARLVKLEALPASAAGGTPASGTVGADQ